MTARGSMIPFSKRLHEATDRLLAIHESGHVIGSIYTGHPFIVARVWRIKTKHGFDHAGEVRFNPDNRTSQAWLEDKKKQTVDGTE